VRIDSRLSGGTTMQIFLPRAADAVIPCAEKTMPVCPQASTGARILVVDDDAAVRWVTVESLREIGHLVEEADCGRAALALLERDNLYDLVVMDQLMPGLLGTETACLTRITHPDLKVLFVTGYADKFDLGSRDPIIMKPFKPETLAEAVSTALRRVSGGNVVPFRASSA